MALSLAIVSLAGLSVGTLWTVWLLDPRGARAPAAGANVLLITIDTLRADRLPPYGYREIDTPALSRLAAEGVLFRHAYTTAPLTLPAHASLLTGLTPPAHGVRDNAGVRLDEGLDTLAEILERHGYRTGGFVSAFVLDSRWGLDQGFETYVDNFPVTVTDLARMAAIQRPGAATWAAARGWLSDARPGPFFLWIHFFEPHTPYDPPEPFRTRYARRLYDGEIAYADALVGQVLAELEQRALLERTLIVVVGDHGEGLGEHGEDEHGLLLYDSTLRIPWIMRLPAGREGGRRIDRAVSLVDVLPTVLDLVGIPAPAGLDGTSLAGLIEGRPLGRADVLYAETEYPRLHFGWSPLVSLRDGRLKYIRAPQPEVYEYLADPRETRNRIEAHREAVGRFDRILDGLTSRRPRGQSGSAPADPETARRLAALGYVASGPSAGSSGSSAGADPKDKTAVYRAFVRARRALDEGQEREGTALLLAVLEQEPGLDAAHRVLREYWIGRKQFDSALETLRKLLDRRPSETLWRLDLAMVLRAAGRSADALAEVQAIRADHPDHVAALVLAAELLTDLGRLQEARDAIRRARERAPSADLDVKLGQAEFRLGQIDEAERLLAEALARQPDVAGAHYLLAQIAEARGDLAEAERAYRREIAAQPWDYQARFNLAMLLAKRGAFEEEAALLDAIPPLAPHFAEVHFYRAKAYLDLGDPARWPDAVAAAQRGLQLAPEAPSAPLGHYVLADVYRLQGRLADASRHLALGQALEASLRRRPPAAAGPR